MHFLSAAFFASGAVAAAVGRSNEDCVLVNKAGMAADAMCGDYPALAACFAELDSSSADELADCYTTAGCSSVDAAVLAADATRRCKDLFGAGVELRRRSLEERGPAPTAAPELAGANIFWEGGVFRREAMRGDDCLEFSNKPTEACDVQTRDGSVSTGSCSTITATVSSCKSGMTCTRDSGNGEDICMDIENSLDIGGIIVTAIFSVAIVAGIATITFLCCKDRKQQKRLAAKAATHELQRAATKKKREAEARAQRAPLIQQEQERQRDVSTGSGAGDPFHDSNRS